MSTRIARGLGVGITALLIALQAAPAWSAGVAHEADDRVVFTIDPTEIEESSSLAVSTEHPHLVYTTNDSGDAANVYVLDSRNGNLVGTANLEGVDAVDIEAIAAGSDGSLVVADIGDNDAVRDDVRVYRFPQPGRGSVSVRPDALTLTYRDGPRDAESVLYASDSGRVFVVSKEYAEAHVYRTPRDVFDHSRAVLTPVAEAPAIATDATFLPGEDVVAIRTYFAVDFYLYAGWERVAEESLPLQKQGESITAPEGGDELWVGSEGVHSTVLAVPVPTGVFEPAADPTTAPPSQPRSTADDEHKELLKNRAVVIGGSAAALFVLVLLIVIVRYIRHHPDR